MANSLDAIVKMLQERVKRQEAALAESKLQLEGALAAAAAAAAAPGKKS